MEGHDLTKFPKLDTKAIAAMEHVLAHEIPKLMAQFPQEGTVSHSSSAVGTALTHVEAHVRSTTPPPQQIAYAPPPPQQQQPPPPPPPQGSSEQVGSNPYGAAPPPAVAWSVSPEDKARYDEVFGTLAPAGGKASGQTVRPILERSQLPVDVLRQAQPRSGRDMAEMLHRWMRCGWHSMFRPHFRLHLGYISATSRIISASYWLHRGCPRLPLGSCAPRWAAVRQVWNLSDIDRDGALDADEFAVAMHLTRECTAGRSLPATLPADVCPPSKRHLLPS